MSISIGVLSHACADLLRFGFVGLHGQTGGIFMFANSEQKDLS